MSDVAKASAEAAWIETLIPAGVQADQIVFVNGRLREDLSASTIPEGLLSCTTLDGEAEGQNAVLIELPENCQLERPVHLVHYILADDCPLQVYPRLLVRAAAGSRMTLIESHGGRAGSNYIASSQSRFYVAEDAVVEHIRVQHDCASAKRSTLLEAEVLAGGGFRSHTLTLGGQLVSNDAKLSLLGEGGHGEINGLYILNEKSKTRNLTHISHAVPNCTSQQVFKGVLDGEAQGHFQGRIFVAKDAQNTDAEQHSDAMLLSERARSQALPELEIYADDVKCAHGATVGTLDEEALFYLRSRGLDKDLARRLLIHAFAVGFLSRVRTPQMVAPLDRLITRILSGVKL
jgi:Fe-S cluster assembly protein SufD